ncbi:hypothetical protein CF319_g3417 [Tilletia indica]|nr:hypothetical protein CF319_g3417 [Tilletia indica]
MLSGGQLVRFKYWSVSASSARSRCPLVTSFAVDLLARATRALSRCSLRTAMRSSVSLDSPPYNGSDRTYDGTYYRSRSDSEAEDVPEDDPRPEVWQHVYLPFDEHNDPPHRVMDYEGAMVYIQRRARFRERDFMTRNPRLPLDERWSLFFKFANEALDFEGTEYPLPYRFYPTMVQYILNIGQQMVPWAHRRAQRTPDVDEERIRSRRAHVAQNPLRQQPADQEPKSADRPSASLNSRSVRFEEAIIGETYPQEEAPSTLLPFLTQFVAEDDEADTRAPPGELGENSAPAVTGSPPRPHRNHLDHSPAGKRRRLQTTLRERRERSAARKAMRNWRSGSAGKENIPPTEASGFGASSSRANIEPLFFSSSANSHTTTSSPTPVVSSSTTLSNLESSVSPPPKADREKQPSNSSPSTRQHSSASSSINRQQQQDPHQRILSKDERMSSPPP